MDLNELKKPFPPSDVSWRVGATNKDKTKGIALAYIDARDVMERLDSVAGANNWQCLYPHAGDKTSCKIGIKIDGEWVWKENGAGDSQVEAEKGAFSDAFKRAAVLWGIGRYLYSMDNVWVDLEPMGRSYKIANPNDPRLIKALDKVSATVTSKQPIDKKPEQLTSKVESSRDAKEQILSEIALVKEADHLTTVAASIIALEPILIPAHLQELKGSLIAAGASLGLKTEAVGKIYKEAKSEVD